MNKTEVILAIALIVIIVIMALVPTMYILSNTRVTIPEGEPLHPEGYTFPSESLCYRSKSLNGSLKLASIFDFFEIL